MILTVLVPRATFLTASAFLLATFVTNALALGQDDPFAPSATENVSAAVSTKVVRPSTSAAEAPNPGMSGTRWRNEDIRKALEEPVDFIHDQTPWSDVAAELEEKFQFNVVLDQSARDDSLTEEEPMTVDVRGIPLKAALRIALKDKNATFIVRSNVLLIISLDDAEDTKYFENSFINVRSLLAQIKTHERDRIGKPKLSQRTLHGAVVPVVGGQKGGGVFRVAGQEPKAEPKIQPGTERQQGFGGGGGPVTAATPDRPVELITAESLLLDLVTSSVDGESWLETGQGLGTIDIVGGVVVMNTTAETTDKMRDFLKDLEFNMSQE